MARTTSKTTSEAGRSDPVKSRSINPDARQHMIGEAAYYRYVQRGFESGHDVEDWLAAEADFERETHSERASARQQSPEADPPEEMGMQHGGPRGPARDDALKRVIRGHPGREIPRVESMEPEEAPRKE